ncbi:MAG: MFS transporter [Gemmataceae bacterium]|nr:MFS transporter [Gemmataceae bacterium]
MHVEPASAPVPNDRGVPWYKTLNRYHWFVLFVSALGWLFDTMDQQLFNLARGPAIRELMGAEYVQLYGAIATTIFMIGWATGGIIFGIMGDRYGRAKTMVITILIYSIFTGFSSFSVGFWDFAFYRFLTGLGVGGEFAVGVALVAEVMPDKARPHALGWLQACSAIGNVMAAFISIGLAPLEAAGLLGEWKPWRFMFIIGALPALLALLIRRRLKEPERWLALRADPAMHKQLGSFRDLFRNPTLRRNAIVGLILATSGVVGLWGIGFFSFDLTRAVFREKFSGEERTAEAIRQERDFVALVIASPDQQDLAEKERKDAKKPESKKRIEHAKERVQPGHLLDAEASLVYSAVLGLYKENAAIELDAVLEAAKKIDAKQRAEKRDGPPFDADKLRALLDGANQTGSLADVVPGIAERTLSIESRLTLWAGLNGLLFNIGAFFGIYSFSRITHFVGRKPAFAVTFVMALLSTAFTFWNLDSFDDIFWMIPTMGYFQIALFGGYAIYFPELFPTRLRSTGTSFCYNVGRYIASAGPLLLGVFAQAVFGSYGTVMSWRLAGVTMCSFFLIGLAALPFAPETKGRPLPE